SAISRQLSTNDASRLGRMVLTTTAPAFSSPESFSPSEAMAVLAAKGLRDQMLTMLGTSADPTADRKRMITPNKITFLAFPMSRFSCDHRARNGLQVLAAGRDFVPHEHSA